MQLFAILFVFFTLTSCQSAYYATMEHVGVHKREIMADRVESAAKAQQAASLQFNKALDAPQSLSQFKNGDLEELYNSINTQYEHTEDAARNVTKHIHAVKDVSQALFFEWKEELLLYSSAHLRSDSEAKLEKTERSYLEMLTAMENAEKQMKSVLNTLRDNRLYLKHNLNSSSIDTLKNESHLLTSNINLAIKNIKISTVKSEAFLKTLKE